MVTSIWDGITTSIHCWFPIQKRTDLFENAKHGQWERVFSIIEEYPEIINIVQPNEPSFDSVTHIAAKLGATDEIVSQLVDMRASRHLRNAKGQKPIDIAKEYSQPHLFSILEPVNKHEVSEEDILQIETNFHKAIMTSDKGLIAELITEQSIRLPQLQPMLELEKLYSWFQIPGYMGGFHYWLRTEDTPLRILSRCQSRMNDPDDYELWEATTTGFRLLNKEDIDSKLLFRIQLGIL